jgi:hypothetical protein
VTRSSFFAGAPESVAADACDIRTRNIKEYRSWIDKATDRRDAVEETHAAHVKRSEDDAPNYRRKTGESDDA